MLSMSYTQISILLSGTGCGPMFGVSQVAACWWLTTQQSLDCRLPAPFESFHSFKTCQNISRLLKTPSKLIIFPHAHRKILRKHLNMSSVLRICFRIYIYIYVSGSVFSSRHVSWSHFFPFVNLLVKHQRSHACLPVFQPSQPSQIV